MSRRKRYSGSMRNFCAFPCDIFQSAEFAKLGGREVKALVDLYMQYRGYNNGELVAAWSFMHKRGWRSKSQLRKALQNLEQRGWIVLTRQGQIRLASLYAVTFRGIDHCGGRLDPGTPVSPTPLHLWRMPQRAQIPTTLSRRMVRKTKRPALDAGRSAPSGGATIVPFSVPLASTGGQE